MILKSNMVEKNENNEDPIPTYAAENLRKGICAIGRFRGQTALFIPRNLVNKVSTEIIDRFAEEVFTKPVLDYFIVSKYECPTYYLLELPPIENHDDQRINKLIEKINA